MILVIGECVLDVVESEDGAVAAHPGGSPANVAVGLARLDQDVTLLTELGDDAPGRQIAAHLDESGVATVADGDRTPQARARLRADGSAEYDFDIAWTLAPDAGDAIGAAQHVHTGSIASHIPPGAEAVAAIVAARRDGATVSYDPNVRPSLVGDREATLARTARLVGLSDVVKASDEDIDWLFPGVEVEDALRAWTQAGPPLAVATLGGAGSVASLRGEILRVGPVSVEVVDTVGAGDSYMAALLDGLERAGLLGPAGRERLATVDPDVVEDVLERAARAAAITVSRAGANPPTLPELADSAAR
ncbi:carbohydrate kinase family protein [Demequina pelophila]|uniref:carbohydrate kinase family protein n=1 Tax=Demequina pelophila TaxID=1638984 RepID=UPI000786651F|nr:carbohydrate kinase [Demequina pelophila]